MRFSLLSVLTRWPFLHAVTEMSVFPISISVQTNCRIAVNGHNLNKPLAAAWVSLLLSDSVRHLNSGILYRLMQLDVYDD